MKCPHCNGHEVHRRRSREQSGVGLIHRLLIFRFRCHHCLHTFEISKVWFAITH